MGEGNRVRIVNRETVIRLPVLVLFFVSFLLLIDTAEALNGVSYPAYSRTFEYTGRIHLQYDRRWGSDTDTSERFSHMYDLGLRGFIVDPRLLTFDVSGTFSQDINSPGETLNLYGFSAKVNLLNEQVRRGILRHFPQPIELRFDYYDREDFEQLHYGISMRYGRPGKLRFFTGRKLISYEKQRPKVYGVSNLNNYNNLNNLNNTNNSSNEGSGSSGALRDVREANFNNVNNANFNNLNNLNFRNNNRYNIYGIKPSREGFYLTFPTFYFDYDKYKHTSSFGKVDSDILSLRAETFSAHGEYTLEYRYYGYDDYSTRSDQAVFLNTNHYYHNPKTSRILEIYNRLLFRDSDPGGTSLQLSNATSWRRQLGPQLRDVLVISGGGRFFTDDDSTEYSLDLGSSYSKYFSERMQNYVGLDLNFGENDDTFHSETVENVLTYQFSKIFTLQNRLRAGLNENGTLYGFGLVLSARTRIAVSTGYEFNHTEPDEGKMDSHRFSLRVSGRLARNMSFVSENYYTIKDVNGLETYKQKTLELRGNVYWNILRFRLNLGASHVATKISNGKDADSHITVIHFNGSTYLSRRILLNLYADYRIEDDDVTALEIYPTISWQLRKVWLNGEYRFTSLHRNDDTTNNHRVFLRVTRVFEGRFRPFW